MSIIIFIRKTVTRAVSIHPPGSARYEVVVTGSTEPIAILNSSVMRSVSVAERWTKTTHFQSMLLDLLTSLLLILIKMKLI